MKKILYCVGVILFFLLGIVFGMLIQKNSNGDTKCKEEPSEEKVSTRKPLSYTFYDYGIPGTTYIVKIDFDKKSLWVKESPGCSYEDCEISPTENSTTLTDDEIKMIDKILERIDFDKENSYMDLKTHFSAALSEIVQDKSVFYSKAKNAEMYEKYYKEDDADGDGIVTCREFGDHYLEVIIEDLDNYKE